MPLTMARVRGGHGAAFGLLPIGWIVLNAIFVYDITVKTGKFEVVKDTIAGLAGDRRIQVLLIAFAFGAFIEGAAGSGRRSRSRAAMLIGLGFKPLAAAGLALIGNTAPVAYGALGTPDHHAREGHRPEELPLSAMAGRQLPLFSLIVPFWLVWAMAGFRRHARRLAGLPRRRASRFAIPQFLVSNYMGPTLVDIIAAASCIVATYLLLALAAEGGVALPRGARGRRRAPASPLQRKSVGAPPRSASTRSARRSWAWMPWIVLSVFVFIWGQPAVKPG